MGVQLAPKSLSYKVAKNYPKSGEYKAGVNTHLTVIAWLDGDAKVGGEKHKTGAQPKLDAPHQITAHAEKAVNSTIHSGTLAQRWFYVPPFLSLACLLAGLFAFTPATAQVNSWPVVCGPAEATHDTLTADKYGEQVVKQGLDHLGNAFRLYASPRGTWTAVIYFPNGTACLLDAGEALESFPMKTGVKS